MTWAQYIATGNGSLAFRLDIGGLPAQFVSKKDMDAAASFGTQARVVGLKMAGVKLKERADIPKATLEVGGMRPVIVDVENLVTAWLGKVGHPTARTWLAANATAGATTITVGSTTGFTATNGYIWIDSECISYTGVTATTFTGCTRGVFNTLAQAHYIADGASLRYPMIGNQPSSIEGQRARLYAYGEFDDSTSSGTLIYTGVVASNPQFDGTAWSIGIDPLTRTLAQKCGTPGAATGSPRGIYYPWNQPFAITFNLMTSAGVMVGGVAESVRVSFPTTSSDTAFFETNQAFCEYLNTKIAGTAMASWASQVRAAPDGDGGWHLEVFVDATQKAVVARIDDGGSALRGQGIDGLAYEVLVNADTGASATAVSGNTRYIIPSLPGMGLVPRGYVQGGYGLSYYTGSAGTSAAALRAAFPDGRIYTGGATAVPSTAQIVTITAGEDSFIGQYVFTIGTGYIDLVGLPVTLTPDDEIAFAGELRLDYTVRHAVGGARDFIEGLYTDAPTNLNLGVGPDIRSGDWDRLPSATLGTGNPFLTDRLFPGISKATVGDILSAELQCAGQYLSLSSNGLLRATDIAIPLPSAYSSGTVTVLGRELPRTELSARGHINTITLKTRYVAHEDEWEGPDIRVRDVAAYGLSPLAREMTIERRSKALHAGPTPLEDIVNVAGRIFGVYGRAYAEVTVEAPLSNFSLLVGNVVRFTSTNVPAADGTMGVTSKPAIIVGRDHDLTAGRLVFTLLLGPDDLAGYCPSASIATETNTSGNIWDVTLDDTEAPTGAASSVFFEVGDDIRVWRFDDTTPATQTGEVTAITGSTVTISLDGAATLGTGTWVLEYDETTRWDTNPDPAYLFLATSAGRVSLPTAVPAWVFSP